MEQSGSGANRTRDLGVAGLVFHVVFARKDNEIDLRQNFDDEIGNLQPVDAEAFQTINDASLDDGFVAEDEDDDYLPDGEDGYDSDDYSSDDDFFADDE